MAIPGSHNWPASEFSTRQFSRKTWPDFERLFQSHPAPGAYPCWCMYNQLPGPQSEPHCPSRAAIIQRNHQAKKALVERGLSHGILVYEQGEPVGWCQYGLSRELPRIDNHPSYRKSAPDTGGKRLWRITCFVVPGKHRRRGIATAALKAALASIRRRGGGIVEAFPIRRWGAYTAYRGTVSMFEKEDFQVVAPLGSANVIMRRTI